MLSFYSLLDYHSHQRWKRLSTEKFCTLLISPFDPIGIELVARLSLHEPLAFDVVMMPVSVDQAENAMVLKAIQEICDQMGVESLWSEKMHETVQSFLKTTFEIYTTRQRDFLLAQQWDPKKHRNAERYHFGALTAYYLKKIRYFPYIKMQRGIYYMGIPLLVTVEEFATTIVRECQLSPVLEIEEKINS